MRFYFRRTILPFFSPTYTFFHIFLHFLIRWNTLQSIITLTFFLLKVGLPTFFNSMRLHLKVTTSMLLLLYSDSAYLFSTFFDISGAISKFVVVLWCLHHITAERNDTREIVTNTMWNELCKHVKLITCYNHRHTYRN